VSGGVILKRLTNFTDEEKQRYTEIWSNVNSHGDEKTKRLLAASMSLSLGYGGIKIIREITGLNPDTIKLGIDQLTGKIPIDGERNRREGGGRKPISEIYPNAEQNILKLVEADTQGDPESPLLWTSKSLQNIQNALKEEGVSISLPVISDFLAKNEYSMQANRKRFEGATNENRNSQFEYINKVVKEALEAQNPVISIDAKKKENIGNYANKGREYSKKGNPTEVNAYDFPDKEKGKVTPYGIYDIGQNKGWVNVGCDHDTAEFAVFSIRQWWYNMGKEMYPNASQIVMTADGGGSNSSRSKLWKVELQRLCDEIDLPIVVCHFPPGTSKWNKIEHRMFSAISMNWRGRPLASHEIIINLISSTTNKSGIEIKAELDANKYKTGIKITKEQIVRVNIEHHETNEKWNYTISPSAQLTLEDFENL
jgi:hypothetical protein